MISCSSCRYFINPLDVRYNIGECRYLPEFQKRYREDWCGQYAELADTKEPTDGPETKDQS